MLLIHLFDNFRIKKINSRFLYNVAVLVLLCRIDVDSKKRNKPMNGIHEKALIHAFFISNTFINNARLKLAKNQANAKQHPEAEPWLVENYSHFSSMLLSKNNKTYSKK